MPVENYEQAIEFLYSRINYERLSGAAYTVDDFKLDRMREFLRRLGDPQESIPAVHVAGTKGKGSTAALIAGALTAAGYRTGLFTSPHISAFEERMAVDGRQPTPADLIDLINAVHQVVEALDATPGRMSPTYFEIATALAWTYFRNRKAQVAVLEVGLGGRLDATNLCRPEVTVITSISRDHTRQLGSRLEQIACEKGGIIKPGIPLVNGATHQKARQAIAEICHREQAPLCQIGVDFVYGYRPQSVAPGGSLVDVVTRRQRWEGLWIPLLGEHQAHNAALAIATLERLEERGWKVPAEAVRSGWAGLRWPGRIEVLSERPRVIIDTAHNWAAVRAMLRTLDENFPSRRRILVFAGTQDKDVRGLLRQLLPKFDTVILTSYQNNPRAVPALELARIARSLSERPVHIGSDPPSAWKLAQRLAEPDDLICVTGSFFIAAELRELILGEACPDGAVCTPIENPLGATPCEGPHPTQKLSADAGINRSSTVPEVQP